MSEIHLRIHQYRFATIGYMLFNMLRPMDGVYPATLDEYFARVHRFIDQNLAYTWKWKDPEFSLYATFHWSQRATGIEPRPISLALAAIYFGSSAPVLAQVFDVINTSEVLAEVNKWNEIKAFSSAPSLNIARFYTIVALIVISLVSKIAGPDFKTLSHKTEINLRGDDIKRLTQLADQTLTVGMTYRLIVCFITVLHGAANPNFLL